MPCSELSGSLMSWPSSENECMPDGSKKEILMYLLKQIILSSRQNGINCQLYASNDTTMLCAFTP